MELLLLGNAVRAVHHFRPEEIGLPREMHEFFPLFVDLGIRVFADARCLEEEGLEKMIPSFLIPLDASAIRKKIREADLVLPFSRPAGER